MSVPSAPLAPPRFHRLIWLMPAAFAPHIAEEYAADFPTGSPMCWAAP